MKQIFAGRYHLEKKIGTGGFSEVWFAKDEMADDTEVAIKIYAPDKGLDDNGIKLFSREYAITAKLQHNNLLISKYFDIDNGSPYLVMPYCSKGSLQNILAEKVTLAEDEIWKILKDVISGLSYLHEQGIIHQDIKPDNVLIYDDGRYMLTDFGISTRMRSTLKKATSTKSAMTLAYAPPERYSANPENTKAGDIFSLGVMLYELATGDVPWDGDGGMVLLKGAEIPRIPNRFSKELQELIFSCMSKDKESRPSPEQLLTGRVTVLIDGIINKEEEAYKHFLQTLTSKDYFLARLEMENIIETFGEKEKYREFIVEIVRLEKTKEKPKGITSNLNKGLLLIIILAFISALTLFLVNYKTNVNRDFTKAFSGSINNKYYFLMDLNSVDGKLNGTYFYIKKKKRISSILNIKGELLEDGSITILEFDNKGKQTGVFEGEMVNKHKIRGKWSKPNRIKKMDFILIER